MVLMIPSITAKPPPQTAYRLPLSDIWQYSRLGSGFIAHAKTALGI
jgi:hypothetical protein